MGAKQDSPRATKSTSPPQQRTGAFSPEEQLAMQERARELKAAARRGPGTAKASGESEVRAKLAELPESERTLATRLHELVLATAPDLVPKTWYGMPAYAREGKVICFFQSAAKFKTRYATLGFLPDAHLDDGTMWPTAYAITALTDAEAATIAALLRKALG